MCRRKASTGWQRHEIMCLVILTRTPETVTATILLRGFYSEFAAPHAVCPARGWTPLHIAGLGVKEKRQACVINEFDPSVDDRKWVRVIRKEVAD